MTQVFLTGISGFLGSWLAELLLSRGYHLIAPVRRKASWTGIIHPCLELIEGSLFDDYSEALRKVQTVIHSAAETRQELPRYAPYWQTNCSATIQLFNTARLCGVKTFLFVSTANTIGHGSENSPGEETSQVRYPFNRSLYATSKLEAETYLLHNNQSTRVVILNPGFMIGPSHRKGGSNRIIHMGCRKKVIFYPPGGKSFVHVKDVAEGVLKALEKGENGEKYLMVNENLSYREFFTMLNQVTLYSPLMISIPEIILQGLGYVGNMLRALGIKIAWSSTNMKILCTKNFYSNRKSVQELGISYTPVSEAICDFLKEPQRHQGTKLTRS